MFAQDYHLSFILLGYSNSTMSCFLTINLSKVNEDLVTGSKLAKGKKILKHCIYLINHYWLTVQKCHESLSFLPYSLLAL